jgi:hypothetical protein
MGSEVSCVSIVCPTPSIIVFVVREDELDKRMVVVTLGLVPESLYASVVLPLSGKSVSVNLPRSSL